MKKYFAITAIIILAAVKCNAQVFFHRIDVTTGNLYSFVASNLLSAGINYLTQDRLLDTSFDYTLYSTDFKNEPFKLNSYNRVGITLRDLIADSSYGVKLGYQSFYPGSFNWGIFGSGHYKINRFALENSGIRQAENIHRLQIGGGLLFAFGAIDSPGKAVVEVGLRYNIPAHYNGFLGDSADSALNKGLTSHYSLRFGGFGILQGIGIFAEIPHYNLIKKSEITKGMSIRPFTVGITYTIMPWNRD